MGKGILTSKRLVVLALVVIAGSGGLWWWHKGQKKEAIRILATETVTRGAVHKLLEQTGIIKAQVGAMVKIGTRVTGTIEQMLVKVGDQVTKGQLVAQIDSRELKAQIDEAQAQVASARAEAQQVAQTYPLRIREAENDVALSRAQHDYLSRNFQRQQNLAQRQVVAPDALEKAQELLNVENSRMALKTATVHRLQKEFAEEQAKAGLAVIKTQAALDALKVRLSYTRIYSPMDGIVSKVTAQEGETMVAGLQVANLITILDPLRLEMWIYVDETDVGQVKAGQKVEFRVDAYPERVFSGQVDTVYPEPEIRDNIVYYQTLVRVEKDQAVFLRPEMTTKVQIFVESKDNVLTVPNAALKWVNGRQVVFISTPGGKVREVSPKLGLVGLAASEVIEGLAEGDTVAVQLILSDSGAKPKKEGR
jgi:HlyD family secretion protein/macrolide-specific efflux system membrane fusion protein